ncbi:hypothetical protein AXE75_02430 [Gardnerella vaginalis]|nr:hypothetical protein [Gardnerella vaginalis]RFD76192.1 hypothetical protein AXE75_02430 [Gardnerella vaginalis]
MVTPMLALLDTVALTAVLLKAEPTLGSDWGGNSPLKGWISVGNNQHLCADCTKVYRAKQEEFERELKEYLNDTNEFTL